jgi:uncharacterized protein YeaO (DUF488 family)
LAQGVTKARAKLDLWLKEASPSPELRKWFGHDPAKWEGFKGRYWKELETRKAPIDRLRGMAAAGPVTLFYTARDESHNSAVAVKEFLERR